MYAKEALLISIKNGNKTVSEFISTLEEEILLQAKEGLRTCEGEITIQARMSDINISDVIEYFQIKEYKVSYNRSLSPFNNSITYKVQLEWEIKSSWINEE